MRQWSTFGAFGETVVELSLRDLLNLLCGEEIEVSGASVRLCFGKSSCKSMGKFPSREIQLAKRNSR